MTTINVINENIEKLAAAERITKATLRTLSRDLLEYVLLDKGDGEGSYDIQPVNRVLQVLTPMNRKTAILFFAAHLPFKYDEDGVRFGKKGKDKQVEGLTERVAELLEDQDFDIWAWAEANVKLEVKDVDWAKKLTTDMTKALEAGLTGADILAIMETVLLSAEVANDENEEQAEDVANAA